MPKHTVVSMPGDGIGKIVLPEARRVLDAIGFDADYIHGNIGWDYWINEGNALPQRTVDGAPGLTLRTKNTSGSRCRPTTRMPLMPFRPSQDLSDR